MSKLIEELVKACNAINYYYCICTRFKVSSDKSNLIVLFDGKTKEERSHYLSYIVQSTIKELYACTENKRKCVFDINAFPVNASEGHWDGDKFVVPINSGMIYNFESHITSLIAKCIYANVPGDISVERIKRDGHLLCRIQFSSKESRDQFQRVFDSKFKNFPKDTLQQVSDCSLNINAKNIFTDSNHIKYITQFFARALLSSGKYGIDKPIVELLLSFIHKPGNPKAMCNGFLFFTDSNNNKLSILVPCIDSDKESDVAVLNKSEAEKINLEIGTTLLTNVQGKTLSEMKLSRSGPVYGIKLFDHGIVEHILTKFIDHSEVKVCNDKYVMEVNHNSFIKDSRPRTNMTKPSCNEACQVVDDNSKREIDWCTIS